MYRCNYCNQDFPEMSTSVQGHERKTCGSKECANKRYSENRSQYVKKGRQTDSYYCEFCKQEKQLQHCQHRKSCNDRACRNAYIRKQKNAPTTKDVIQEESRSALEIQFPYFYSLVKKKESRKKRGCIRCGKTFGSLTGNRICADCSIINERLGESCYNVL